MRRTAWLSSLALLSGCVASSALIAAGQKESRVEKAIPASGIRTVRASVEVGSLRIRTDSAGDLKVVGIRRVKGGTDADQARWLQETKVEIDRQGDTVVIKDIVPESLKKGHGKDRANGNLMLEVRLPRGLAIESAMGVGDINADGSFGPLKFKTGVGHVSVSGDAAELLVNTGVGDLKLADVSISGTVADLNAGVGNVDASLRRLPSKDLKIRSGVGNAEVRIPSSTKATASLRSGVGTVKSDFPLTAEKRGPVQIGGSMKGEINGGGANLTINSGTGNVNLARSRGDG